MAVEVEVIGKNYWSRRNGVVQRLPIGSKLVVRGVPEALKGKLKVIKEVDDAKFIINDSPEADKLRSEGKHQEADRIMASQKEGGADDAELAGLREKYTELTGEEPDKRWKSETLKRKISEASDNE